MTSKCSLCNEAIDKSTAPTAESSPYHTKCVVAQAIFNGTGCFTFICPTTGQPVTLSCNSPSTNWKTISNTELLTSKTLLKNHELSETLVDSMMQELSDYRKILCLPPYSLADRVAQFQNALGFSPSLFIVRPKDTVKTLQSMPAEILNRIADFVDARDIIPLYRTMCHYRHAFSNVFRACIETAEVFGITNLKNVWPTFHYPKANSNSRCSRLLDLNEAVPVFNLAKCLNKFGGEMAVSVNGKKFLSKSLNFLSNRIQLDLEAGGESFEEEGEDDDNDDDNVRDFWDFLNLIPENIHVVVLKIYATDIDDETILKFAEKYSVSSLVLLNALQNRRSTHLLNDLGRIHTLRKLEVTYAIDYHEFPLANILKTCKNLREITWADAKSDKNNKLCVWMAFAFLPVASAKFKRFSFGFTINEEFWELFDSILNGWKIIHLADTGVVLEKL